MVTKEDLSKSLLAAVPVIYRKRLQKAIDIARIYYGDTIRLSGDPLLSHVLRSARHYADLHIDFNGIIATLLHHRLPASAYGDKSIFTDDVMHLLNGIDEVFAKARAETVDTQVIYKYILSFKDDIRIALVKLAEKYDNAKTIELLVGDKKFDVARRLLSIYAPLAEYLNLAEARSEFELNGFRVLHPKEYEEVALFVHSRQKDIFEKISAIKQVLQDLLDIVSVSGQVWGRVKSYYSVWKKQNKYEKEGKAWGTRGFNDLLAFTVMVDSVDQCYAVAYALKDYANVPDDRFEDYIRHPKPNGFSEIQLVCQFPDIVSVNVEVQILTKDMYWHNTYGPASHIAYKLAGKRFAKSTTEYQWVEHLHQEIEKFQKNQELPEKRQLQVHLFQDRIFTFTPKHRVIELPLGATVLDFAYQVHSDIGNQAIFGKINGKTVPLDTVLESGSVIEVITDPKKRFPTEAWLTQAKTHNAISRIKAGLRKKTR